MVEHNNVRSQLPSFISSRWNSEHALIQLMEAEVMHAERASYTNERYERDSRCWWQQLVAGPLSKSSIFPLKKCCTEHIFTQYLWH